MITYKASLERKSWEKNKNSTSLLGYKWLTGFHNGVVIELGRKKKKMIDTRSSKLEDKYLLSNILKFCLKRKEGYGHSSCPSSRKLLTWSEKT